MTDKLNDMLYSDIPTDLLFEEYDLEREAVTLGQSNYEKRRERRDESSLKPGRYLIARAITPLADAIQEWVETLSNGKAGRHPAGAVFLRDGYEGDYETVAYIALRNVINNAVKGSPATTTALSIVSRLEDELEYRTLEKVEPRLARFLARRLTYSTTERHQRAVIKHTMHKAGVRRTIKWGPAQRVGLGYQLLRMVEKLTELVVVELEKRRKGPMKPQYMVRLTPEAITWLEGAHERCALLQPTCLPMVVKPRDWTDLKTGGYLFGPEVGGLRKEFVKRKARPPEEADMLKTADLSQCYEAVNALQSTAWRINRGVYHVLREVWNQNGTLGKLPSRDVTPLPAKPEDIETNEMALRNWKREAAKVHADNARSLSKRFAVAQKLWLAEKFLDKSEIFFPWNLDWRGRAYPMPSLMNPQADDSGRALLQFANGKRLGETGAYWLAVHIANLFGVDKCSLDERVAWVEDNTPALIDSATNPLDGERFWVEADKPYMALAACFEWMGFCLEGEDYISHLPVSVDGSCNGLQNFSAMLRDPVGGAATNLVPHEKPADIYQIVADKVALQVQKDVEAGKPHANLWLGKITRKLVKRPVMTLPYGAGKFGMRYQLIAELTRHEVDNGAPLFEGDNFHPCGYLSAVIYETIGTVVIAARQAMDWLQEAARALAAEDLPMTWTTPIGFRCTQHYGRITGRTVSIRLGQERIDPRMIEEDPKVLDKKKQTNGVSPNFVHSMDAAHLMLTILACKDAGIESLAMVHDSYGTHAADCELLAGLLRRAFVEMYQGDTLKLLAEELQDRLPAGSQVVIPEPPEMGDLDLAGVLSSDYFFA